MSRIRTVAVMPTLALTSLTLNAEDTLTQRVAAYRKPALDVNVDGRSDDWKKLPTFEDPAGDGEDASRDIVALSIAPRDDDLLIRLSTRGRPSRETLAFWFYIDVAGHQTFDAELGLAAGEAHTLHVRKHGAFHHTVRTSEVDVAIADAVEVRIPFAVLLEQMKEVDPAHATLRSWCRVKAHTWNHRTREFADHGPAVASYRLTDPAPSFDPTLPEAGAEPQAIALPLKGQWYIDQGAFGVWTHQSQWAYDLSVVDPTLHPSDPRESRQNEDYYSWGKSVTSPVDGTVLRVRKAADDGPTFQSTSEDRPGNEVLIDLGDDTALWLGHLQRGSVVARGGQTLRVGEPIARVGNSGRSAWSHLHVTRFHVRSGDSLPLAFSEVRVGLNPGPSDPWSRNLETWEPREGFFVEPLPKQTTAPPAGAPSE